MTWATVNATSASGSVFAFRVGLLASGLALLVACDRPTDADPARVQEPYEDSWTEAGKRVAIIKPVAFDPKIDPTSIKVATGMSNVGQAYRDYDRSFQSRDLAAVAVVPLYRQLGSTTREAFAIKSEFDECHDCPGYINYTAHLEMPSAERYRLVLTVTVSGQTREWSITRGFRELNVRPGHLNEGEGVRDLVRTSITLDMTALGREACEAIVLTACEEKLRP